MAVIGAVIGVGIIGAVVYDNHSDYSDYSNYTYSNYSDAAERRKRRLETKNREINQQKYTINTYKTNNVNEYLKSPSLKQQSGVDVNVEAVRKDGDSQIDEVIKGNIDRDSFDLKAEIKRIDKVIDKIDKILGEEGEQNGNDGED